jgi:antirestriction protein
MADTINIAEASVYVGTYRKYNDGSLAGAWLELKDYADIDGFYEACAALHQDEEDPEYMFQDYENIPRDLVSESWISDKIFEVLKALEGLNENETEAFSIWCNNGHYDLSNDDPDDLIRSFRDEYRGQYRSEEDFATEYVADCYDLPDFVAPYFDYEKYAHELFMTDYWYEDGHVFRNS